MKLGQDCLGVGKVHFSKFNYRGGPANAVKGIFNLREDWDGIFLLMWKSKLRYNRFNYCGVPVKAVKGGFNLRKDRESSFHTCGSTVKLVQVCLGA